MYRRLFVAVNPFHARRVRESKESKNSRFNICPEAATSEIVCKPTEEHLSNPKPGHTTVGSDRSPWRSGWAGLGKMGCKKNHSHWKKKSTVPSNRSKKNRFNVSSEARTGETPCKPTEKQNQRLTTGFSAVCHWDEKRALFLAAELWNDACLSL